MNHHSELFNQSSDVAKTVSKRRFCQKVCDVRIVKVNHNLAKEEETGSKVKSAMWLARTPNDFLIVTF